MRRRKTQQDKKRSVKEKMQKKSSENFSLLIGYKVRKYKIFAACIFDFMNTGYLLIGGNLGNRKENLMHSCILIEQECGIITQKSSVYETAAWGYTDQPAFYNQVIVLQTKLSATELLSCLLDIEKKCGRIRKEKMGPRTVDIDILLFNNEIIHEETLTVPHPALAQRRFALVPLNEVAPDYIHPVLKKTISAMLKDCHDELFVHKI